MSRAYKWGLGVILCWLISVLPPSDGYLRMTILLFRSLKMEFFYLVVNMLTVCSVDES